MLWILRRTRGGLTSAVSLLNTLNNNSSSSNTNDNRPPRKNYNRLSGDEQVSRDKNVDGKEEEENEIASNSIESDNDSNFTEIELDDRDDFSDDSDYDETLTCNVCDRSFACSKQLSSHKQKKRHFGCSACDSLFPSLMALEHHKEEFEHWSGDEDDICTDSEEDEDTYVSEECERLL